ncbi:MAG: hypothetical protein Q8R07_01680, partial [Candidatus Uhrbacteria bacterium]|nr:hypothetical protein [Candidatus Uhrbacteria bacterium]
MMKDQCISVTELRTKTKKCLEDIEKEPKYVFLNNHPIAVILGVSQYEDRFLYPQLVELRTSEVGGALAEQAKKAKMTKK